MATLASTLTGTMLIVFDKGILITGAPGIGKSELALSLLDRGHLFLSDDLIEIKKEDQQIIAEAPSTIHPFLHTYGLGITNVAKIFGPQHVVNRHPLDFIIHLKQHEQPRALQDPFHAATRIKTLFNLNITEIELTTANNRNWPLAVEILLKNRILAENGDDAGAEFLKQHQTFLNV